jgi:hypothetical protein
MSALTSTLPSLTRLPDRAIKRASYAVDSEAQDRQGLPGSSHHMLPRSRRDSSLLSQKLRSDHSGFSEGPSWRAMS